MLALAAAVCLAAGSADAAAPPASDLLLWPSGAPGARGTAPADIPLLTPYPAKEATATGAAMVICPGGGYGGLAQHEGRDYALWLNELGIHAFVLRYRLGTAGYRHPVMLHDVSRAVRLVRFNAAAWGISADKIGLMGSSAGGHLASTLLTHFDEGVASAPDRVDRSSSRPDLGVLCYPVITMGEFTHAGSRRNLLGDNPDPSLLRELSNELQVSERTPPTFLFHTVEDAAVPVRNSLEFAAALARSKVPFALHVYPKGVHGIGLGTRMWDPAGRHPWVAECARWLAEHRFTSTPPGPPSASR